LERVRIIITENHDDRNRRGAPAFLELRYVSNFLDGKPPYAGDPTFASIRRSFGPDDLQSGSLLFAALSSESADHKRRVAPTVG